MNPQTSEIHKPTRVAPIRRSRGKGTCRALLTTLVLVTIIQLWARPGYAAGRETSSTEADKAEELSPRMLDNRFKEVIDNIKVMKAEIRDLQAFQTKIKAAETAISAPKTEVSNGLLKSLKDSFEALQSLKGDVDPKADPVQKFLDSFDRLDFVGMEFRRRGWDWEKQPQVIAEVGDAVKFDRNEYTDFPSQLPKMRKLFARLRSATTGGPGGAVKWDDLKPDLSAAIEETQQLDDLYKRWIADTIKRETDYLGRLEAAFQTAIQLRLDQAKQAEKEQNDLAKKLDRQQQDQHSTDKLLVYAVYAMILAIVGLFLSLHLFKDTLATAIVNERTMIELLSMGFLLLTLIILGTGRQLQETTLGTLLGTVAGYIFGRKEGEKRGAQEERKELAKMVTHPTPAPSP